MAMTFSVSQKLSDVERMVDRWNTLHGLQFESLGTESEAAVWGAGKHCLIIAERVTDSQTQFHLVPLRRPTDRLAQSAWDRLRRLFVEVGWVGQFQPTDEVDDLFGVRVGWVGQVPPTVEEVAEWYLACLSSQAAPDKTPIETSGEKQAKANDATPTVQAQGETGRAVNEPVDSNAILRRIDEMHSDLGEKLDDITESSIINVRRGR